MACFICKDKRRVELSVLGQLGVYEQFRSNYNFEIPCPECCGEEYALTVLEGLEEDYQPSENEDQDENVLESEEDDEE